MNAPPVVLAGAGAMSGLLFALAAGRLLVRHGHHWTDAVAIEGIAAIGAVGWLQSYLSLRALALLGREPEWGADTWPALLDVFALVMGLAAVRARREGRQDRYAEILAVLYSLTAIAGNVWTSLPEPVTVVVHGLPPLTMVVGWHWLLRRSARPEAARAAPTTGDIGRDIAADAGVDVSAPDVAPAMAAATSLAVADRQDDRTAAFEDIEAPVRPPVHATDGAAPPARAHGRTRRPREVVRRLVRRRGPAVTTAEVVTRTGVSKRHVARLLAEERQLHLVADQPGPS